ncbi:MAG: hypothetical protein KGH94_02690 [Candidatus Micrarchaeota archaeon]|nr:hypothetical protein [Candidatus Micrarchaeota archaeon]
MIYRVQIRRRMRNIKVYNLLKSSKPRENAITKLFERIFVRKSPAEAERA